MMNNVDCTDESRQARMTEIKQSPGFRPDNDIYRAMALGTPEHVNAVENACKLNGHEVVPVTTIAEGMDFLNRINHVDVIVAETHLENESVFDFLKAVKAEPQHKDVRFMMLCINASDLAKFANQAIEHAATILGVDKYVLIEDADETRLAKEIDALMPETLPKKEQEQARL